MNRFFLLVFAGLGALSVSCGSSHQRQDRCAATQECFAVNDLGCCSGTATTISVCEGCPSGTVPRGECRTSGCDEQPCSDAERRPGSGDGIAEPPRECREDLGGGCCGDPVYDGRVCGRCPAGTMETYACATFAPECGTCGGEGVPAPAPPIADAGAFDLPPSPCFRDLGKGCCLTGDTQPVDRCGGCPEGRIQELACTGFARDFTAAYIPGCREFTTGCCGDWVPLNPCDGTCPPGSIADWECRAADADRAPCP